MRTSAFYALLLLVALALAGCSVGAGASGFSAVGGQFSASTPTATSVISTPVPASAPSPASAAGASPTPIGMSASANSSDPAIAAIRAVIEKANQEQQDAFEKGDPTLMQDTATSDYYDELVQINSDMARGGVSAIKLVKIEWGEIELTSPTTARATTFETWRTSYRDGSTDQSRDENDYTLILENGVWKIQSDENPGTAPSGPGGGSPVSGSPGSVAPNSSPTPAPPAPSAAADQADISRNWSGYAATSGSFTAVTGTWTVPQPRDTGSQAAGATWVGIGGVRSRDLIQAGTQETVSGSGAVHYNAWIETLPRAARQVPFSVSPGDSVTVSISQQSPQQWLIEFQNNTTGESYQTTVQYASSLSSAEWIHEAPSAGRRVLPIDDFGTVQFSGGSAVRNGRAVTIAEAGAQPITMAASRSGTLATPSVLTPDGQGFSISQSAPSPGNGVRPGSSLNRRPF